MPSAGLHRFGRGATLRKFVARPRRAFSFLQHLGRGRELAQRARGEEVQSLRGRRFSLAASGWARTITCSRFYREGRLKEDVPRKQLCAYLRMSGWILALSTWMI